MGDFGAIVAIYDQARAYMVDEGNYTQWGSAIPTKTPQITSKCQISALLICH